MRRDDDDELFEDRTVEVDDPSLSAGANRRLTEQVREVVGADHVRVPADRPHPSHGESIPTGLRPRLTANRWALGMGVAIGVVVGVIVALVTSSWWLLPVAIVVLGLATFVVVEMILGLTDHSERPDPSTVALMEDDGVHDPEERFSEFVDEFTASAPDGHRTTAVEDDPAQAASEQDAAGTPTGGPSQEVGPGSGIDDA